VRRDTDSSGDACVLIASRAAELEQHLREQFAEETKDGEVRESTSCEVLCSRVLSRKPRPSDSHTT
jgi:hypothetical protein